MNASRNGDDAAVAQRTERATWHPRVSHARVAHPHLLRSHVGVPPAHADAGSGGDHDGAVRLGFRPVSPLPERGE